MRVLKDLNGKGDKIHGSVIVGSEENPITFEELSANESSILTTSLATGVNNISKSGNTVKISFYTSESIIGGQTIATVPEEYRPQTTVELLALFTYNNILVAHFVKIGSNGNIVSSYTGGQISRIAIFDTYIL